MNILITGCKGFLGKNLKSHLIQNSDYKIHEYNREDSIEVLKEKISACDVIFHLAGENRTEDELNFEKNKGDASNIIVPFNNGTRGNPVIFGRHFYNELSLLKGDEGGKKIIDKNKINLVKFLSKSKGYFFDIDIQSDILKLNSQ